jgi:hypothetical protein
MLRFNLKLCEACMRVYCTYNSPAREIIYMILRSMSLRKVTEIPYIRANLTQNLANTQHCSYYAQMMI